MKNYALLKPAREYLNFESLQEYCLNRYDLPVSRVSIYRAVRSGKLSVTKANARNLFRISDIDKWILGGEDESSENPMINQEEQS